ncbi:interleukin-10 isoform X1 [Hemibagrus wyckioides]|uniref:interleukin-10 isoform X1 n=1 Tax=Hemibagrus wyckioides TaxID=337641 RepID=UPI00266D21CB|nr:interleukin-10 isoform X1 [Hemibagrus wyckioides]
MLLLRFLLLSLLAALLLGAAQCKRITCQDSCCSFVEGFPVRLKALRSSYSIIRDYYESKDELDTALFNRTVLQHFKSSYGCSVMNDVLHFYLETVLPSAIGGHVGKKNFKAPIDTIGNLFQELKRELVKCVSIYTDLFTMISVMQAQAAAPERTRAKKAFVCARLPMSPAVRYKMQNVFPL